MSTAKSEDVIQKEIVEALLKEGARPIHIPNEQRHGNAVTTGRLIAMGMLPGAADLLVPLGNGKTLFLEVKTPTGRQSEWQKRFEDFWCRRYGYQYRIVRSAEEALEAYEEAKKC